MKADFSYTLKIIALYSHGHSDLLCNDLLIKTQLAHLNQTKCAWGYDERFACVL
jgi:hypothetical protein